MPMQPSPRAETSRLFFPSVRFCIIESFSPLNVETNLIQPRCWGEAKRKKHLERFFIPDSSPQPSPPLHGGEGKLFYGTFTRRSTVRAGLATSQHRANFCNPFRISVGDFPSFAPLRPCVKIASCNASGRAFSGGSPHRSVCCLHGGEYGEAFDAPRSQLVEPVQNIQSLLQNSPKGNHVARFI